MVWSDCRCYSLRELTVAQASRLFRLAGVEFTVHVAVLAVYTFGFPRAG